MSPQVMAYLESSVDANNRRRNNSDELDVFEATRYFSGYADVVLESSNPRVPRGEVKNPGGRNCASLPGKDARYPSLRVTRKSLDVPTERSEVLRNGADVVGAGRDRARKDDRMLRQPSSPGGKVLSFVKSLFNPSTPAEGIREKKEVKKAPSARSLKEKDENKSGGLGRRRRSSISHFRTSSAVADSRSLPRINIISPSFSHVHPGSKTPPPYTTLDAPWRDLRSSSDPRPEAISVSMRSKAREAFTKWKVSCSAKGASNPSNVAYGDNDGNDSDSSSDLFELPVHDRARIESIRRSSMSTVLAGSAFVKLHV